MSPKTPKIEDTTSKKAPPPKAELTPGGASDSSATTAPHSPASLKTQQQQNLPSMSESTTANKRDEKKEEVKKEEKSTEDKKTSDDKVDTREDKCAHKVEQDDSTDSVFTSNEVSSGSSQVGTAAPVAPPSGESVRFILTFWSFCVNPRSVKLGWMNARVALLKILGDKIVWVQGYHWGFVGIFTAQAILMSKIYVSFLSVVNVC